MLIPDTRADRAEDSFPCQQARFLTVNLSYLDPSPDTSIPVGPAASGDAHISNWLGGEQNA